MQTFFNPPLHAGEFPVHTTSGNDRPFAVIELGPGLDIRLQCDEDFDRAMRATARARAMWQMNGKPHQFAPMAGNRWHCDVCGDLNDKNHPKAAPAIDGEACPSVYLGEACTVREVGHRHHYGPDRGAGVRTMWTDDDLASRRTFLSCGCSMPFYAATEPGTPANCSHHGSVTIAGHGDPAAADDEPGEADEAHRPTPRELADPGYLEDAPAPVLEAADIADARLNPDPYAAQVTA